MAKFETIVRPVVFPDIRPARARAISPQDDPEQGAAVIRGASGKVIDLPYSFTQDISESRHVEVKRRVDEVRVKQMDDDGTVIDENFIDIFVTNKIWSKTPGAGAPSGSADEDVRYYYRKVQEADNIEIRERNKILKNPDA